MSQSRESLAISISKADAHGARGGDKFAVRIDEFEVADRFRDIDSHDAFAPQADHLPEIVIGDEFGRLGSETSAQHSIAG